MTAPSTRRQNATPRRNGSSKSEASAPSLALTFVLFIEDPERFKEPRDIDAYLGLVPRSDQSRQRDKQLPISKSGNRYLRGLLVQCAQYLLGRHGPDSSLIQHVIQKLQFQ